MQADTTRRGPDVADEAVWTVGQLQELFDEWVVACWQNRPHEGLSHTWGEGRDLSPNEMYAACVGVSGYVPLPLGGDDYMELLPAAFRTVNDYGLTIDNRTYDCKALNPYRRLDSGLPGGNKKRWEVRYGRPLRHHRRVAAGPPVERVGYRAVGLPLPGRAAVRPRPVGARAAHDHRTVRSPPGRGGHRQERC